MTVKAEEAEKLATLLETTKANVLQQLDVVRQEVTGDPAALEREAEGYRAYSERAQRVFESAGVESRSLESSWSGPAHQAAQDRFKRVRKELRVTVLDMNAERGRLFRNAAALKKAPAEVDQVKADFAAEAQTLINEARARGDQVMIMRRSSLLVRNSIRQALAIRNELARALAQPAEPPRTLWRLTGGRLIQWAMSGDGTSSGSRPMPDLGLDPQATEFSQSLSSLVGRMNMDSISDHANALRNSSYADRFGPWIRLTGPNGEWDLKPYYDRMFGMADRNNFHIPLPPEVGTVDGRQVEIDRDLLGNIHYGYVASSIGPAWATTAAVGADGFDYLHGRFDEGDRIGIAIGRDLHDRFPSGQQITPQHTSGLNQAVVDALRTNFDELVRTGKIRVR